MRLRPRVMAFFIFALGFSAYALLDSLFPGDHPPKIGLTLATFVASALALVMTKFERFTPFLSDKE